MQFKNDLPFTSGVILYPLLFVMIMWIVLWAEVRFGVNLKNYGIYPQRLEGLRGIIFGPFIHGGLKHLFNNSVPIFVLSMALFYFYRNIKWKVLLIGLILTGFLTWLIGRPAYHIGASGIVYLLAAFVFFKGALSRHFQLAALALAVVFLYGGLLWYVLPIDPMISWEGHLSGLAVGIALAFIFRKNPIEKSKYAWEQPDFDPEADPFLKHFDDDGNFIEELPEEQTVEAKEQPVRIVYTFKKKRDEE